MPLLTAYISVSLDGYFTDAKGDMSWAHKHDPEWQAFVSGNASGSSRMLFGRRTYQLMAGYWPTPAAAKANPVVTAAMNDTPKFVASRTLGSLDWANSALLKGDLASAVAALKQTSGPDIVILGSGSIVAQLTEAGLIDRYQIVLCPLILGGGRALFGGVTRRVPLALASSRAFGNGNVVLTYSPAG